jgi:hypothetical protein
MTARDEDARSRKGRSKGKGAKVGLSRRQLLAASGGAVGGAVLGAGALPAVGKTAEVEALFGVVERIERPRTVYVRNPSRAQPVKVVMAEGAAVSPEPIRAVSPGPVKGDRLSSFSAGEEVVVTGRWNGDEYVGRALEPCYRVLDSASVKSRSGNRLRTNRGTVRFDARSEPRGDKSQGIEATPLNQIESGDQIWTTAWRDPADGNLVARVIGIRQAA